MPLTWTARLLGAYMRLGTFGGQFSPNYTYVLTTLLFAVLSSLVANVETGNWMEARMLAETARQITPILQRNETDYLPDILEHIAKCESGDKHAVNGNVVRSKTGDWGRYQINAKAHLKTAQALGLDIKNETDNELYALYLFQKNGVADWSASRSCWIRLARF